MHLFLSFYLYFYVTILLKHYLISIYVYILQNIQLFQISTFHHFSSVVHNVTLTLILHRQKL